MPFDLLSRRELIYDKLLSRTKVEDCGYRINGTISFCMLWTGPTSGTGRGGGYGRMCLDGQTVATHLVAFTNEHGFIPGKKQIDHKCNQRLCWNPAHLEMVTHKTNQKRRDKRKKCMTDPVIDKTSNDIWHKQMYENALASADVVGPKWEDLTDEQRQNIRNINVEHQSFMNDLGKAIHDGSPLPNPLTYHD